MSAPNGDVRFSLLRETLDAYRAEYDLLADRWKALETKAQGTVAIAGIFLAGTFTFVRNLQRGDPALERWLLVLIAALLTATVLYAVLALRVREIADPVPGAESERMVLDICSSRDEEIPELIPGLYGEQFGVWRKVNERLRDAVEEKARRVRRAQLYLSATALLMCITSIALAMNLG